MNMRNCGGRSGWRATLYHSGFSGDVDAVMRFFIEREGFTSVALIGYSMGGNLVLKLAGDLGAEAPEALEVGHRGFARDRSWAFCGCAA